MADATVQSIPSAKALGKRKMEYRPDGTPVAAPTQVAAPLPSLPPLFVSPPITVPHAPAMMAEARAASCAGPDTSQDEHLAKILQEEADEEARQLRAQKRDSKEDDLIAEHELFGDDSSQCLDSNDLNAIGMDVSGRDTPPGMEEEEEVINISRTARQRRARVQRDIFGDEDEEEETWDFNGTEWVRVSAAELITSLGLFGTTSIKTEVEDAPTIPIVLDDLSPVTHTLLTRSLVPLSVVQLAEAQAGEQATWAIVQRAATPHPDKAVTTADGDFFVPHLD